MANQKKNQLKNNKGFTLLEYAMGAAVIATIVWGAMSVLGQNMSNFFGDLGNWVEERGTSISSQ